MEEVAEDGKESTNSAHANGMNEWMRRNLPPNYVIWTQEKQIIRNTVKGMNGLTNLTT
jgi:hypothetical protein